MAYRSAAGQKMTYTATGNVANGSLLLVGATIGRALNSGVTGASITLDLVGQHDAVAKDAGAGTNWVQGGRVYYMVTGSTVKLTGVAAAGQLVGYAPSAAATGATTGSVVFTRNAPTTLETQA